MRINSLFATVLILISLLFSLHAFVQKPHLLFKSRVHFLNSTATYSTENHHRDIFKISDSFLGMEKLNSRLQACGVQTYYFINDIDANDQLVPSVEDPFNLVPVHPDDVILEDCVHVKTLIWRGSYLRNTVLRQDSSSDVTSIKDVDNSTVVEENKPMDFNGTQNDSFYFVTALKIDDKVDLKQLRRIVNREWPSKDGSLILQLAEQSHAEIIAGFASGSIPPGWHSMPLKLFIDDAILKSIPNNDEECDNYLSSYETIHGIGDGGSRYSRCIMSVGSGSKDYSLHVSLLDVMKSSIYISGSQELVINELGSYLGQSRCDHHTRNICSFTRKSARTKTTKNLPMNITSISSATSSNMNGSFQPMNLTRRMFQATAKKKGTASEMRAMVKALGNEFVTFMKVETDTSDERFMSEFNKNALHYAAWKGDLETISLLIDASNQYKNEIKDIVNTISTGEGCYGKSAIFYAITQCRDDVVLYLLSQGADLLIVNNKGQTPSSLAVNKLKEETCRIIFKTEESQLKSGRQFVDYRRSHSDNKRYGDLDPRFLEPGDANYGDDIIDEIKNYRKILSMKDDKEKKDIFESKPYLKFGIIDLSLPRSVRVTTPIWRKENYIKLQKEKEQQRLRVALKAQLSVDKVSHVSMKMEKKAVSDKFSNNIVTFFNNTVDDIDALEVVRLKDVLPKESTWQVVDDIPGIQKLQSELVQIISCTSEADAKGNDDYLIASTAWGLDCEWRPSHTHDDHHPVATLQLSSGNNAYVIDMISLCRNNVKDLNSDLMPTERLLSDTLSNLFIDKSIRILGFGIVQDLSKLAASYPHMPCFYLFNSVIDLHSLSRRAYPRSPRDFSNSLQKAVAVHFRKKLDKSEQCSEWDLRPLRSSQLEYASLDAAILPKLLLKMVTNNPNIKEDGNFLQKEGNLQISYRFTHIGIDDESSYKVEMGSLKRSFHGGKLARQSWPTFYKNPPNLPRVAPAREHKIATCKKNPNADQGLLQAAKKLESQKSRKTAIDLTQLTGDLRGLPTPGQEIGYTKESCIMRVLRTEIMETFPDNSYLRYNRRGGIIEIGNAWLLFVNFGVGRSFHKYRNDFREGGRLVTFTVNPARNEDSDLLQNLFISENCFMYRKAVLLFIRGSTNDKFTYCGSVSYCSHEENEDLVNVVLELDDFKALHRVDSDEISAYSQIVITQLALKDEQ
jgi:hypothetical protein